MLKWLWELLFPNKEESQEPGVTIHDFTDRVPGHDIALTSMYGFAEAVISSLEEIKVGEIILVLVEGKEVDFLVTEVETLALLMYRAKLEVITPDDND